MFNGRVMCRDELSSEDVDWRPLEAMLPLEECGGFMYMYLLEVDGRRLHHYKHIDTRNYLIITDRLECQRYIGDERYVPIPTKGAIWHVLKDLACMYPDEYPPERIRPLAIEGLDEPRSFRVCWHTMKRTTVKLPDELDARLRHEAARRGSTVSQVTREAIESHLGGGRRRLIAAKGGRSGYRDTARKIEQILRREARR